MDEPKEDVLQWLMHRKKGGNLMKHIHDLVSAFKGKSVSLKNPAGAEWVICDLNGTIYNEDQDVLNKLQKFYLPDEVKMQVIGQVTGTSYPCEQLLLLARNGGNICAYDGEELHVVASYLKQLCTKGLKDPASQSYYKGEAFKDLTEEDWNKVRQSEVGKRLDREHDALVNEYKSRFLKSLKNEGSHNEQRPSSSPGFTNLHQSGTQLQLLNPHQEPDLQSSSGSSSSTSNRIQLHGSNASGNKCHYTSSTGYPTRYAHAC